MKKGVKKHIEQILKDYTALHGYLEQKRKLQHITLSEDKRLTELERQKNAVEYVLNKADEKTRQAIQGYYMVVEPKTWDDIAIEVFNGEISTRTLKRRRDAFFEVLAERLGW